MVSVIRALSVLINLCVRLLGACVVAYVFGVLVMVAAGVGAFFGGVVSPQEAMAHASIGCAAAVIGGLSCVAAIVVMVLLALGLAWFAQRGVEYQDNN